MKLGDIIVANYGKSLVERERIKGPIPVYGSSGLTGWHNTALCNSEAIIVGRKGNVGAVHYTQGPFYCIDTTYYILPSDNVNFKYLYYNLIYQKLGNLNDGSPVPGLKRDNLYDRDINLPDAAKQQRIAGILSAYDNLIDNNQKQIKLLEEAAMRLYKEWFVKLRFPRHENTKIVDGVPEGWEYKEVGSLISKTPRTKQVKKSEYKNSGEIPIIDQSREFIAGYTDDRETIVDLGVPVIVFGDHTRILKLINFPFAKGADGTQLIVSGLEEMPQHLLYCSLLNIDLSNYHYARHFKYLKASKIIVPTKNISEEFESIVEIYFKVIQILRDKIFLLQKSRDFLLPKLMNGEIEV